ncbi:MAG: hypothetical protein Q8N12_09675 [Thermodesulfovibrionales bacterium]|nr:hypothetical protein [Thermodesulfovibrionales bacterium]
MRFSEKLAIINSYEKGQVPSTEDVRVGIPMIFERLWKETGIRPVIEELLGDRKYRFPVERAIFLTVLHRLSISGSDRAAEKWKEHYKIPGAEGIELHHLYRAMAWLGEKLPEEDQRDATPFTARCIKDLIEEGIFQRSRDLFGDLTIGFVS